MTFEFAWKPRWATIRLVNSWARSTLDISRRRSAACRGRRRRPRRSGRAGVDGGAVHRVADLLQAGRVVEVGQGELASGCLRPLEKTPTSVPSRRDGERLQRPMAEPSWLDAGDSVVSPPYSVSLPVRSTLDADVPPGRLGRAACPSRPGRSACRSPVEGQLRLAAGVVVAVPSIDADVPVVDESAAVPVPVDASS